MPASSGMVTVFSSVISPARTAYPPPRLGEEVLRRKAFVLQSRLAWIADLRPVAIEFRRGGRMQSSHGSGGEMIRVLVADDTRIHTQLLADALRRDRQLEVISPPLRSRDLVETVKLHKVDVVVLSSNLDEEPLRGFELLRQLRASDPGHSRHHAAGLVQARNVCCRRFAPVRAGYSAGTIPWKLSPSASAACTQGRSGRTVSR